MAATEAGPMNDRDTNRAAQTGAELRLALARLEEERLRHDEVVEQSAAIVAVATEEVKSLLARYKAALDLAELPFEPALARELYWEHPEVKVSEIATLIGVPAHQVHAYMGTHEVSRKCRGRCGRTLTHAVANRTAAKSTGNSWRWCEECRAERDRQWEESERRHAAQRAGEREEEERLFDEALAAGVRPTAVYVELPGVQGTWRVDELPHAPSED